LNKESIYYGKAVQSSPELSKEELEKKLYRLLHYALEKENAEGMVVEALGSLVILVRVPDKLENERIPDYSKALLLKIKDIDRPAWMAFRFTWLAVTPATISSGST
jgi:hypothetical protein